VTRSFSPSPWTFQPDDVPEPVLRVRLEPRDGLQRVVPVGEVDSASVDLLCAAVEHALAQRQDVQLVMSGVTFCDVAAIEEVLRLHGTARDAGRHLVLTGVRPFLLRVLTLMGVADVLCPQLVRRAS
jgi:anti-anti-sigma factor